MVAPPARRLRDVGAAGTRLAAADPRPARLAPAEESFGWLCRERGGAAADRLGLCSLLLRRRGSTAVDQWFPLASGTGNADVAGLAHLARPSAPLHWRPRRAAVPAGGVQCGSASERPFADDT